MSTIRQLSLSVADEDAATRVARAAFAAIQDARAGDSTFRLTADTLATALRAPLAKEMPKAKPLRTKRNPLFDAIAHGFGWNGNITRAAGRTVATALKDILEVDPDVTPDDLTRGCDYVKKRFTSAGPMALPAHWHEISRNKTERTRAAKLDIYQEPAADWRSAALKLYPDALEWGSPHNFAAMDWRDVSTTIRPDILKAML